MKKLIVFDLDGVLLDSKGLYINVFLDYSEQNNLQCPCVETIFKGYTNPDAYDFGWGVSKEEQRFHTKKLLDMCNERSVTDIPRMFPEVEKTLAELKGLNNTLAAITAKPKESVMEVLCHHGLQDFFSEYRYLCDVERRGEAVKPAPDMLKSVMKDCGFTPQETVMIGDTTADIEMGINADTSTIGVTWGYDSREKLEKAGAHHIIEEGVPEITPTVKKIFVYDKGQCHSERVSGGILQPRPQDPSQ